MKAADFLEQSSQKPSAADFLAARSLTAADFIDGRKSDESPLNQFYTLQLDAVKNYLKETGKDAWEATKEIGLKSNLPTAMVESVATLGAGMAGFTTDMGARVIDMAKQFVGKGDVDWEMVSKAGQEAAELFSYQPRDPGAKHFIEGLAYIPQKGKQIFYDMSDTLAKQQDMEAGPGFIGTLQKQPTADTQAALKVAGDITELLLWGKVFGAAAKLKPKALETKAPISEDIKLDTTFAKDAIETRMAIERVSTPQRPLSRLVRMEETLKAERVRSEQQQVYEKGFSKIPETEKASIDAWDGKIERREFYGIRDKVKRGIMTVEDARSGIIPTQETNVNLRITADAADLAADYKARGIERQASYSQFVKDRALKPEMNAKQFFDIYDNVSPKKFTELYAGLPINKLLDPIKNTRFWHHWKEFWQPFSTVPKSQEALFTRYKGLGKVAQAERIVGNMHKRLDAFPEDVKVDMFRYLDGQIPVDTLPVEARNLAKTYQGLTERVGRALVDRGIIKQEQFDAYKGRYIHYMYAKHILGDKASIGIKPTGKLDLTYTKNRNPNMTNEQRRALGWIEDASTAYPVGMGKALTDIAKFDYLAEVAREPSWVWEPSIIEVPSLGGKSRKMGIGKLVEEVETYRKVTEQVKTPEVQAEYKLLKDALDKAREQTRNVPNDFKQIPTSKNYGPLAGAYVRKPIANDIIPLARTSSAEMGKILRTLWRIEQEGMSLFKAGKVAVNPPTAFRNVVSNVFQQNMRGAPLWEVPNDIVSACRSYAAKDIYYQQAFKHGMFKTNWAVTEINEVLNAFSKVEHGSYSSFLEAVRKASKYYGRIDDLAKLSVFKRVMTKEGGDIVTATLEAQKWGMDYSLASRSIKGLRRHIVPFISYQYKIAPLIAESLQKRPWVIGKFMAIPTIAAAVTKKMHDLTEDDWNKLERDLPNYIKRSGSYVIKPFKDPDGNWQWVNLEYYFPWGNAFALFRDLDDKEMGETVRDLGIGNPYLDIFQMLKAQRGDDPPKHPFYGTEIYNRLDPPNIKAAKMVEALAQTWLPSALSSKGALGYSYKAAIRPEEKDRWGRKVTPAQAIGRWFGFNIVSMSPKQTKVIKFARIKELEQSLKRILRDPASSPEDKKRAKAEFRKQRTSIIEGKQ